MNSTGINGRQKSETDQVFNLLNIISNPEEYSKRMKALSDATEENRKFVELAAPASEILKVREEVAAAKVAAEAELAAAKADAKKSKADADAKAKDIIEKASAKAKQLTDDAFAIRETAVQEKSNADALKAKLDAELAAAKKATDEAKAAAKAADEARVALEAAKKAADDEKARLVAWHNNAMKDLLK